ncbi:hypothetical protein I3843_07G096400 [Carya illinoinensis]|nr:hypothetical protein I3843_07G096400 [Carya illinoinensis]
MDSRHSTISSSVSISTPRFRCFDPMIPYSPSPNHSPQYFSVLSPTSRNGSMENLVNSEPKIVTNPFGYILEDVPHLTNYILDLPRFVAERTN